jgi:predicted cupin superfamily sugar epimerase
MFHFYLGDPCRSITMSRNGVLEETILGQDLRSGMKVQHLVPGGTWQATKLQKGGRYALLGTTMSPGFHVTDFELGTPALLHGLEADAQRVIREVLVSQ